jgi:hypothetical protein
MAAISRAEPAERGNQHLDFGVVDGLVIEDQPGGLSRGGPH